MAIPELLRDPGTLEMIVHLAIKDRDWQAVDAALRRLAVVDPHRCQTLVDICRLALHLTKGTPT